MLKVAPTPTVATSPPAAAGQMMRDVCCWIVFSATAFIMSV
jgi:hypothetical protein